MAMSEIHLNHAQSERVYYLLHTKIWAEIYPELRAVVARLQKGTLTEDDQTVVIAHMDALMRERGFWIETPKGEVGHFVFQDDSTYAQFLLQWS